MRCDVTGGSHPKRLLATFIKGESAADGRTHGERSVRCDGGGRREEGASVLVAAAPAVIAAATLQLASTGTVCIRERIPCVSVWSVLSYPC